MEFYIKAGLFIGAVCILAIILRKLRDKYDPLPEYQHDED